MKYLLKAEQAYVGKPESIFCVKSFENWIVETDDGIKEGSCLAKGVICQAIMDFWKNIQFTLVNRLGGHIQQSLYMAGTREPLVINILMFLTGGRVATYLFYCGWDIMGALYKRAT